MSGVDSPAAAEAAYRRLLEVEEQLARPESPAVLAEAVERLEQSCREWPALMACVTDRAVWESLAQQIRRLERLAEHGGGMLRAMDTVSASERGYTACGEPAQQPAGPAKIDCRG